MGGEEDYAKLQEEGEGKGQAQDVQAYFSPTYAASRAQFLAAAARAGATVESKKLEGHVGSEGEGLFMDFAVFRKGDGALRRVVLVTSGTHGVEGFAGAAVIAHTLEHADAYTSKMREGDAIVLVHAVNPYGMSWYRRWNENNVDLNRNFLTPEEFKDHIQRGVSPLYARTGHIMNPKHAGPSWLFYLRVLWLIIRNGYGQCKQALAGGQYVKPEWLFFGGCEWQWSIRTLKSFVHDLGIRTDAEHLATVTHLDVHTGLGPKGHTALFVDNEQDRVLLSNVMGGGKGKGYHVEDQHAEGTKGTSYQLQGTVHYSLRDHAAPNHCNWLALAQEVGTVPGLFVVKALRAENALHQRDPKASLSSPEKQEVLRAFYPVDRKWKSSVVEVGKRVVQRLVAYTFAQ